MLRADESRIPIDSSRSICQPRRIKEPRAVDWHKTNVIIEKMVINKLNVDIKIKTNIKTIEATSD